MYFFLFAGRLTKNGVEGGDKSGLVSVAAYKQQFMVYHRGWGSRNFVFGWGPNFGSKGTVGLFLWQITSHRDDHVFLNL